jgi:hypothetical protein
VSAKDSPAQYVFHALRERARPVLIELRDARGDRSVVTAAWAERHSLSSPMVLRYGTDLRDWWLEKPTRGLQLNIGIIELQASYRALSSKERAWMSKASASGGAMPDPEIQTLAEWIDVAGQLYREREEVIYCGPRPRPASQRRDRFAQHCEWFVEFQVNRILAKDIAKAFSVDRAAVEHATKRVASFLGLQRRSRPLGRPRKCET